MAIKYYKENGDVFCGYAKTKKEAKDALRQAGYKTYYIGRDYSNNDTTIVGIDQNNTVLLPERRQNGLVGAKQYSL